jgi:hypothetical protein
MSKHTAIIVSAVLALGASTGIASAGGWRALHIDGTSQAAFEKSVAAFQQTLPMNKRLQFEVTLRQIWQDLAFKAGAEASVDQVAPTYFAKLDGLGYKEVIRVGGPEARKNYAALSPTRQPIQAWSVDLMHTIVPTSTGDYLGPTSR